MPSVNFLYISKKSALFLQMTYLLITRLLLALPEIHCKSGRLFAATDDQNNESKAMGDYTKSALKIL